MLFYHYKFYLLALEPAAFKCLSVFPCVNPIPMFFIIYIIAFIWPSILVHELAFSEHLAVLPLPIVWSSVWPDVDTLGLILTKIPNHFTDCSATLQYILTYPTRYTPLFLLFSLKSNCLHIWIGRPLLLPHVRQINRLSNSRYRNGRCCFTVCHIL